MGKYNGAVITTAGQNLIAQAIAESKTVTFTTAQASSHAYPSSTDFEALTALTDVEKTVDINYAGVYSDTVVQVSARFDNTGVETAYLINTLGFFAQLGTDAPILFAVSTAVTPDQMPVFDADNPSAFIYNMQMTVQNANSINLSVNPSGTVTVDQLSTTVNEINAKIGDLASLTTDAKSNSVAAINEVNTKVVKTEVLISNSGDAYSSSKAYKVGDLCIYNNTLYRCITACSAGSWATNQSCFTQDTLVNITTANSSKINTMDELISVTFTPVAMQNSLRLTRYGKIILSPQDALKTKEGTYSGPEVVATDGNQYSVLGYCSYGDAVKLIKKDIPYNSSIKLCIGNMEGVCIYFYLYNYHNSAVSLYSSSFKTTISNISTCFLMPSVV